MHAALLAFQDQNQVNRVCSLHSAFLFHVADKQFRHELSSVSGGLPETSSELQSELQPVLRHLRRKILRLCQNMIFLTHMYELFYSSNLNKKGGVTVVWIIFPKVYLYKKLKSMRKFCVFLCSL